MCPVTRSEEAIIKMSETSKGNCVLGQFISCQGFESKNEDRSYNPHTDRDTLLAYFYILWNLGYNSERKYF
jgi:hypothetical protein